LATDAGAGELKGPLIATPGGMESLIEPGVTADVQPVGDQG
jgi:hypothetical protein